MSEWILIGIAIGMIAVLVGVVVAVVVWKRRKEKPQETNYRAFYRMGIVFLPIGIVMMIVLKNPGMLGLTALGIVYMAIGLQNRDKWKKKAKKK